MVARFCCRAALRHAIVLCQVASDREKTIATCLKYLPTDTVWYVTSLQGIGNSGCGIVALSAA